MMAKEATTTSRQGVNNLSTETSSAFLEFFEKARAVYEKGDYEAAIAFLDDAILINNQSVDAFNNRGS